MDEGDSFLPAQEYEVPDQTLIVAVSRKPNEDQMHDVRVRSCNMDERHEEQTTLLRDQFRIAFTQSLLTTSVIESVSSVLVDSIGEGTLDDMVQALREMVKGALQEIDEEERGNGGRGVTAS